MRSLLRTTFAALTLSGVAAFAPLPVQAADDIHCFSKKAQTEYEHRVTIFDILGVDEDKLTDAERIDMLEEYELNGWSQLLAELPWLDMQHRYGRVSTIGKSRIGKGVVYRAGGFHWLDAWTMMGIENHAELMSRRTGSRYMYVSPVMKRRSRERDVIRGQMRRKCYGAVAYLG
ncbi:MAG: hypothetical protein ACR2PF_01380 [Rhizobiaceae bacterium]